MTATAKVLLLEDQMMIAFGIKAALEKHGFEVVGPFSDLASADETKADDFDLALLDINLGNGATSESFADRLLAANVPFMFLSGYGSAGQLPERFAKIERMTKPVREADLIENVSAMAAQGRG